MSKYIHKSHNVSVLLYHVVCPLKYRRSLVNTDVEAELCDICDGLTERYELFFVEIGCDGDHVHFLVQSVPTYSPTKIVRTIKSITARELFRRLPWLKEQLWGGEFWTKGYFISTVGRHADEETIRNYVKKQGKDDYRQWKAFQLELDLESGSSPDTA
jgi:putative transposase